MKTEHPSDRFIREKYGHLGYDDLAAFNKHLRPKLLIYNRLGAAFIPTHVSLKGDDENVTASRGRGSSDMKGGNKSALEKAQRTEHIIPDIDNNDVFRFNYSDMLKCELDNGRFKNRPYNIIIDHDYYNDRNNEILELWKEQYEEDLINGNIDKIAEIYRRLSTYINENRLNKTDVITDGSILVNIAIMIDNYIKTGIKQVDTTKFSKIIEEEKIDLDTAYQVFLIHHCFSNNLHYGNLLDDEGKLLKFKWLGGNIGRRFTNKDMKSKNRVMCFTKIVNNKIKKYNLFNIIRY